MEVERMNFDDVGYYEPEQAGMILDEYMGKMREALTEAAKNEIERLRRKNKELSEANKKLCLEAANVREKARELQEKEKYLEAWFYQKKFSEILEPFMNNITVYMASDVRHDQKKCSYCDDDGYLIFTAKNGQETRSPCECQRSVYWYEPVVCELKEISLYKYQNCDGKTFIATGKFARDDRDDDRFFNTDTHQVLDTFSPEEYMELKKSTVYDRRIVFTSKEECQKCCDWLNAERKKKEMENGNS
jgi:hypothetical protein